MKKPKIGIVGVGMVGGPLARYFQETKGYRRGTDLFLYDTDPKKNYSDDPTKAEVIFVCVPSPRNPNDGSCDTSIIEDTVRNIAGEKILVIKSTVPPGTTERLQKMYPRHKLLFNPEFLTESRAWEDMARPDRQIVGFTGQSLDAARLTLSLLPKASFMSPGKTGTRAPVRITATEAELIKYAGNVYLARKVNWANALATVAEKLGVDYENVRKGMAADHRIGNSHLDVRHGGYRGFGGFCFPKDTSAFLAFAKTHGFTDVHNLLQSDWKFNEELLKSQGLTVDDVSVHDHMLLEKLRRARKNA